MACRNLQLSRCEEWGLLGVRWTGLAPLLGLPKKKKQFRPEEYRNVLNREESGAVSRIEIFFKPCTGLVSTKNKALSIKRA
jgi:hypothetical protein